MNPSTLPAELLDSVVAYFHPRRIILFGSQARGDANPDSDIELVVILDDAAPPEKTTLKAGYESRRGYHRSADVIPVRESTYARKAKVAGTLAYEVAQDGVVVYERG